MFKNNIIFLIFFLLIEIKYSKDIEIDSKAYFSKHYNYYSIKEENKNERMYMDVNQLVFTKYFKFYKINEELYVEDLKSKKQIFKKNNCKLNYTKNYVLFSFDDSKTLIFKNDQIDFFTYINSIDSNINKIREFNENWFSDEIFYRRYNLSFHSSKFKKIIFNKNNGDKFLAIKSDKELLVFDENLKKKKFTISNENIIDFYYYNDKYYFIKNLSKTNSNYKILIFKKKFLPLIKILKIIFLLYSEIFWSSIINIQI